jgi:hypothetical protein
MTQPARRPDHQGWAYRRLLDIHDGMRNDLALLRRAVTAVTEDGQDAGRGGRGTRPGSSTACKPTTTP